MRGWLCVAVLLLSAPAFAQDAPHTLEGALAQAAAADKPLVIELTAAWCGPCRYFEQKVLPLADVQAELEHVMFVRYDFDSEPGVSIARQFQVSGVPTFLVFDRKGGIAHRYEGLGGHRGEEWVWFVTVLRTAVSGHQAVLELVLELKMNVAAHPDDAEARMALARAYRDLHDTNAAAEQYTWIIDHTTDHAAAGLAMAERDDMLHARERVQRELASAAELVRSYPESEAASFRIALLGVSRYPPPDLADLVRAHLKRVPLEHWPNAVRAAIVANQLDAARASVFDRVDPSHQDALTRLVQAEVAIVAGDPRLAVETLERTCGGKDYGLWCYVLQQTVLLEGREPPTIARLRTRARAYLSGLEEPDHAVEPGHGIERLLDSAPELGDALALSLRTAVQGCAVQAQRGGAMFVAIDLAPGGRPRRVRVQSREGGALDRCVERALQERPLPPVPGGVDAHVHTMLVVPPPDPKTRWRAELRRGISAGGAARFGDVQTYGFAARFAVDLDRFFVAGGQLELAAGDTGAPAFAARALAGLHVPVLFASRVQLYALAGVGVSDLSKHTGLRFDVPVEERIIVPVGPVRLHLWADLFDVVQSGFVETGYGAAISMPLDGIRVLFGAEAEHRTMGDSVQFTIGFPVGSLY